MTAVGSVQGPPVRPRPPAGGRQAEGTADEFAALLAGLGGQPPTPAEPVVAEVAPDEAVVVAAALAVLSTVPAAAPVVSAPAVAVPQDGPADAPTPPAATPATLTPAVTALAAPVPTDPAPTGLALTGPATTSPAPAGSTPAAPLSTGAGTAAVALGPETAAVPALDAAPVGAAAPAAEAHQADAPSVVEQGVVPRVPTALPEAPPDTSVALPTLPGAEHVVTSAPGEVRTGEPARAAAPTVPVLPAQQVVSVLAPVLEGPDGTYSVTLQLYPEELGAVQVEVALLAGEITLRLHADDDVAQEVLRAALPDLKAELEASGLSAGQLSMGDGRSEARAGGQQRRAPTGTAAAGDATQDSPALPTSDPDAALDVRI